ncbi:MAG: lysophospholipid acyltransferase family protein [Verrucomicrobiae bacterium]|nr:lysophospholipid acyltransferase family protein [Verrucomicrobiae bacterium]
MKYLQLKLAEFLAHLLPRGPAYAVAQLIAELYVVLDRRGREAVISNLRRIHRYNGIELSEQALRARARRTFLNFAKYLVDFFKFLRPSPEALDRILPAAPLTRALDELLAHGRGVVVVTAHLGNWELGASAVAARGYKLNVVTLQVSDPKLNALYQQQRKARQLRPIPMGRAGRECVAALRRNELVGLVADRDFTAARDTIEFFGQPARLPRGPAKLALATGAPLLPVFAIRQPDDTFVYLLDEAIWPDKQRDSVETVTRRVASALERAIGRHSEQWYVFHDLWDVEQDLALAARMAFGGNAGPRQTFHG